MVGTAVVSDISAIVPDEMRNAYNEAAAGLIGSSSVKAVCEESSERPLRARGRHAIIYGYQRSPGRMKTRLSMVGPNVANDT